MDSYDFQNYLIEVLDWATNEDGMIQDVDTFESAGVMSRNEGLVVKMRDGEEFQITIVKSN